MKKALIKSIILNVAIIMALVVLSFMAHNFIGFRTGCIMAIIAFIGGFKCMFRIINNVDEYRKYFNIG